ncbi:energy transducer TonB [Pedobacter sp. PF22-3]|uniref:energy transducer TonB n=1 Tax=Pedobacter sp. PF22-3 TaxID=2994467 RepID=UPI002247AF5D|nr:energy transducer TonB [Pedobacter sp. PF22-3]MCX2496048.1 energy transducer TonB [Pedobacter sp. PF22-3]
MKKYILTFIITSLFFDAYAQKATMVTYFKKGMVTLNKDDYDYRRVIEETDTPALYRLSEFYPDNTEKTSATVSKLEPKIIYEGLFKGYNKKGILTSKVNFKNGMLVGECSYYYDDGKLENVFQYNEEDNNPDKQRKWITGIDSLGNQFIKDGNGRYKKTDKGGFTEEGSYLNGYKDGIWKGTSKTASYEEIYEKGIFKSGLTTLADGKQVKYDNIGHQPEFKGGIAEFYKYLGRNYKFPSEAQRNRVNGRLYISFVVEKDGSLTDYEFKNNLGYGTQEEAVRVLNECPKWIPGVQHGIPVRVKYNININLAQR